MTTQKLKNEIRHLLTKVDDPKKLQRLKDFLLQDIIEEKTHPIGNKQDLIDAFKDIKLYQEGKKDLQTAKEFLEEL